MATATLTHPITPRPLWRALAAPFRALWRLMVAIGENDVRLKTVERLNDMSDAELAKIGLKRDEIVHHVFGALYYT